MYFSTDCFQRYYIYIFSLSSFFNIKHVTRSFDLHKINVRRTIISNSYAHIYISKGVDKKFIRDITIFVVSKTVQFQRL